jgi:hypothetical protein
MTEESQIDSRQEKLPSQWIFGALPEIRRAVRDAGHSKTSSAEVKETVKQYFNSSKCFYGEGMDKFNFTLQQTPIPHASNTKLGCTLTIVTEYFHVLPPSLQASNETVWK